MYRAWRTLAGRPADEALAFLLLGLARDGYPSGEGHALGYVSGLVVSGVVEEGFDAFPGKGVAESRIGIPVRGERGIPDDGGAALVDHLERPAALGRNAVWMSSWTPSQRIALLSGDLINSGSGSTVMPPCYGHLVSS